jgi:tetratricopeptide (TPR) repeat protein
VERACLARACANRGRLQEALDLCDGLLAAQPELAPAYLERARLRLLGGRRPAADVDLLVGLALASRSRTGWPEFAALNARAGEAAAARGDWPGALEQFNLALLWQAGEPGHLRRVGLAHYNLKHYAAATRYYADALASRPTQVDPLKTGDRYNAACCAVLAGAGQGEDAGKLDDKERTHLRREALEWLQADLSLWGNQVDSGAPVEPATVQQTLRHWQKDTDLAGVRDQAALANLPEAERVAWQKLWADVDATMKKVAEAGKK